MGVMRGRDVDGVDVGILEEGVDVCVDGGYVVGARVVDGLLVGAIRDGVDAAPLKGECLRRLVGDDATTQDAPAKMRCRPDADGVCGHGRVPFLVKEIIYELYNLVVCVDGANAPHSRRKTTAGVERQVSWPAAMR